ncbi:MAG: hypothetical protein E7345_03980 [Clostridiales bacterium]|nr:hypothetical protein [Clostridiales bacterium]
MKSVGNVSLKDRYLNNELFYNLMILTILFFLNCFWGEMSYVTFTFLLVIVFLSELDNGFTYLVYSIPFCLVGGDISGFLFIFSVVVFMIKGYVKMIVVDKKPIDKKFAICFVLFIIYLLLPFGEYNDNKIIKFVVIVGLVLVAYLMTKYPREFRIKINVNILALSLLISIMCFSTYFISDYLQETIVLFYLDDFIRFQALLGNPNILAMICEICLSLVLYFMLSNSNKISWVEIFSLVVFTIVGVSTFSKTFLLLLCVMILCLCVFLLKKYPIYGLAVLAVISIIALLFSLFKSDLVTTYITRFFDVGDGVGETSEEVLDQLTTHRSGLWITYLKYLFQYPISLIFGMGLGTGQIGGESTHNIYISSLYQMGIVGVTIFVLTLVFMLKEFKKEYPLALTKAFIIPLVVCGMLGMVEDLFMYIYL